MRAQRQLRDRGVLVPETVGGGRLATGRGRSVVYHINFAALQLQARSSKEKGDAGVTVNPDTNVTLSDTGTVTPETETLTSTPRTLTLGASNPDTGVTRSEHQRSSEGSRERFTRSTGADAPPSCSRSPENETRRDRVDRLSRIISGDPRLAYMAKGKRQRQSDGGAAAEHKQAEKAS